MSGLRLAMAAALLALPAAAQTPTAQTPTAQTPTAQTGTAFAGLPGVTFQYYDVPGRDAAAIHRALLKRRPTDPHDGKRVDALTQTWLQWSWPVKRGGCDLQKAVVKVTSTVQLPRLPNRATLPADLLRRWDRYIVALEAHEAQHVRHSYDGRADVLAAIAAATCDTANAAAGTALAVIQARDVELDRATRHGEDAIEGF